MMVLTVNRRWSWTSITHDHHLYLYFLKENWWWKKERKKKN